MKMEVDKLLKVLNQQLQQVAILENAYSIGYDCSEFNRPSKTNQIVVFQVLEFFGYKTIKMIFKKGLCQMRKQEKELIGMCFERYRLYSRGTKSGGAVIKSSGSGGGSVQTSSSGGGVSKSTASGGGTVTTSGYGQPNEIMPLVTTVPFGDLTTHKHSVTIEMADFSHNHNVSMPAHSHNFDVPAHTHSLSIPEHAHEINIPDHSHDIDYGIFLLDRMPTAVQIKVDGNTVPYTDVQGVNIDIIPYLSKDAEGKINRGWHTIEITPNDLARINAQVYSQVFIQSRGGGSY